MICMMRKSLQADLKCLQGTPDLQRRLRIASFVYSFWTKQGTDPARLASRFLDGSVDALQIFISTNDSKRIPLPQPATTVILYRAWNASLIEQ